MLFSRKQTTTNIGWIGITKLQGQAQMALDFLVSSGAPVFCLSDPGLDVPMLFC